MAQALDRGMGAKGGPKKMSIAVEIEKGGDKTPMEGSGTEVQVMKLGRQMDETEEAAFGMAAPSGDYSLGGLNALVDGLNALLPMFGVPDYERFAEPVEVLPSKFVKQLTMVNEAAAAAGLDDMTLDLSTMTDDKSLKMAAGKLRALAGNTSFKRFLRSERPEPAEKEMQEPPVSAPPPAPGGPSEDEVLMGRMG